MYHQTNYIIYEDEPTHLTLQDVGPWNIYKTITNDVENVVKELAGLLNGRRLFYIDSEEELCEILHENGEFVDFKFVVNEKS